MSIPIQIIIKEKDPPKALFTFEYPLDPDIKEDFLEIPGVCGNCGEYIPLAGFCYKCGARLFVETPEPRSLEDESEYDHEW